MMSPRLLERYAICIEVKGDNIETIFQSVSYLEFYKVFELPSYKSAVYTKILF